MYQGQLDTEYLHYKITALLGLTTTQVKIRRLKTAQTHQTCRLVGSLFGYRYYKQTCRNQGEHSKGPPMASTICHAPNR